MPTDDAKSARVTSPVHVYGADESPWVAAVMSYLYYHNNVLKKPTIEFTMLGVPGPRAVATGGLVMPALYSEQTGYLRGTYTILSALGCDEAPESEWSDQNVELEKLFGSYVLTRSRKPLGLLYAFSTMLDEHPSALVKIAAAVVRPIVVFYFFSLLLLGSLLSLVRGRGVYSEERMLRALRRIEARMPKGAQFFGGDRPNQLDFGLFGHIQCMSCGLSDVCLPTLLSTKRLGLWVKRMNKMFEGYKRLYSRRAIPTLDTRRDARPPRSDVVAMQPLFLQLVYWVGFVTLLWNIRWTAVVLIAAFAWRYMSPERSMNKLLRKRYSKN